MSFEITLTDASGNSTTVENVQSISTTREHTALSDFSAETRYDEGLDDWIFSEVLIHYESKLLFRGFLESTEHMEEAGSTSLSGRGVGKELTNTDISVSFSNKPTDTAISEFWNQTSSGFSATVQAPSPSLIEDGTVVQDYDTTTEFSNVSIPADKPFEVRNGSIEVLQTCFVAEGEDNNNSTVNSVSDSNFSGGDGIIITDSDVSEIEVSITTEYDIPASEVGFAVRQRTGESPPLSYEINGDVYDSLNEGASLSFSWDKLPLSTGDGYDSTLSAGTHTVRIQNDGGASSSTAHLDVDILAVYDKRFNYFFDDDNGGSGGYLDGPELFPDSARLSMFDDVTYTGNQTMATVDATFNESTSGDGARGSNNAADYISVSESDATLDATFDFGANDYFGTELHVDVEMGRYGTTTGSTPLTGVNGQTLDSWTLKRTSNDRSIIDNQTFEGSEFEVARRLHEFGSYRFNIPPKESSKEVESFPRGTTNTADWTTNSRTRARDARDYANKVTIKGELSNGSRPTATIQSDDEINRVGQTISRTIIDTSLSTVDDCKSAARTKLVELIAEDTTTGSIEIVPKDIPAGYSYYVDAWGEEVALERVSFSERFGDSRGSLDFTEDDDVTAELVDTSRLVSSVQRQV